MARVFSWKVAPNKYSYLIKDSATGSYIRSRITDASALHKMAEEVDGWTEPKYRQEFISMRSEVNNVYGNFYDSDYKKYYEANPVAGGDIVLLSGKDFYGSGVDGGGGGGGLEDILSEEDYEALKEAIEETFRRYRDEIEENARNIREAIEADVSMSIMEALNRISDTEERLRGIREEMQNTARDLQDALDAARNAENGNLTQEDLEAITKQIKYFHDWIRDYSGSVVTMKTDYDNARRYMGSISTAEDVAAGLFSLICTNINTLSGTVGTVQRTMNASEGSATDTATWYDELKGEITEITRKMNAKESIIEDLVNFVNGDSTNQVYTRISGVAAAIVNSASHQGTDEDGNVVDLTEVYQLISALSGKVKTEITRLDNASGRLTTIVSDLDTLDGKITTSLTRANSALTAASDMRETWDSEIGILRTVSDMVIKTDENGDPIYWYVDPELEDPADKTQWVRVYYQGYDENTGLPYYTTQKNGSGTRYDKNVLPDYMSTMLSYIQQNSDSIEFAVTSGDVITALKLSVEQDGQRIIYGLADKVILDADVIANSLAANAANIGGVHIGEGMISAKTGSNKWALNGNGVLEATGAKISGAITATSLYLGTQSNNQTIEDYIDGKIAESDTGGGNTGDGGHTDAEINNLIKSYVNSQQFRNQLASSGIVSSGAIIQWAESQGYATTGAVQQMIDAMEGAEVNMPLSATTNQDGSVTYRVQIGNQIYTWDQVDTEDFLVLGSKVGNGTEGSKSAMTIISKDGLLTANNAVIYGAIYASEGHFQGTVEASDIILNGHSLKMSGSSNTFEISNTDIDVKYVPETVTIPALNGGRMYNTASTESKFDEFTATGNTTVIIPPEKITISLTSAVNPNSSYSQAYNGTLIVQAKTFIMSGYDRTLFMQNGYDFSSIPSGALVGSGETYCSVGSNAGSGIYTASNTLTVGFGTLSNKSNYELKCKDKNIYLVGLAVYARLTNYDSTSMSYYTGTTSNTALSFINSPESSDIQFFNIGRNGMQIFLDGGFYFTAAYDKKKGQPIVAMGGKRTDGQMIGLKLDPSGIKILKGVSGQGWVDP